MCFSVGEADGAQCQFHHYPGSDSEQDLLHQSAGLHLCRRWTLVPRPADHCQDWRSFKHSQVFYLSVSLKKEQKGQNNNTLFSLHTVVPSQPSEFKGEAKSETSILLSWVAPPQGGPDNQITGYELVYRRADDTEEVSLGQMETRRVEHFGNISSMAEMFSIRKSL